MVNLFSKKIGNTIYFIKDNQVQIGKIDNVIIKNNKEYFTIVTTDNVNLGLLELADCYNTQAEANVAAIINKKN